MGPGRDGTRAGGCYTAGMASPTVLPLPETAIPLPIDAILDFCRRWKLTSLSLFGRVLSGNLEPDEEVGVLIDFPTDSGLSLYEWIDMKEELEGMFGHPVEMTSTRSQGVLENPFYRRRVLDGARLIYAV